MTETFLVFFDTQAIQWLLLSQLSLQINIWQSQQTTLLMQEYTAETRSTTPKSLVFSEL